MLYSKTTPLNCFRNLPLDRENQRVRRKRTACSRISRGVLAGILLFHVVYKAVPPLNRY